MPNNPPPQTPIDTISFILEDLAVAVELANEKTYNQELDEAKSKAMTAIYNLLAAEAVMCPWEWDGKKGLIELVPLSKVKEMFDARN